MHAPALSGREARDMLDKVLRENAHELELDRDVFEAAYKDTGPLEYKSPFERFCRTGELALLVVSYCQNKLWRNKL